MTITVAFSNGIVATVGFEPTMVRVNCTDKCVNLPVDDNVPAESVADDATLVLDGKGVTDAEYFAYVALVRATTDAVYKQHNVQYDSK